METSFDSDKRKILSIVSHGSIFVSQLVLSAGIPLAIMVFSEDSVAKRKCQRGPKLSLQYVAVQHSFDYPSGADYWLTASGSARLSSSRHANFRYFEQRERSGYRISLSVYLPSALVRPSKAII